MFISCLENIRNKNNKNKHSKSLHIFNTKEIIYLQRKSKNLLEIVNLKARYLHKKYEEHRYHNFMHISIYLSEAGSK